jgi:hypothetical protein
MCFNALRLLKGLGGFARGYDVNDFASVQVGLD